MKNKRGVKSVGLPALLRGAGKETDNHLQFLRDAGYSDYQGECKEEFSGRFIFRAQSLLGMATEKMSIASVSDGKVIGSISAADLPAFMRGQTCFFEPIEHWKTRYSQELKALLGLDKRRQQ